MMKINKNLQTAIFSAPLDDMKPDDLFQLLRCFGKKKSTQQKKAGNMKYLVGFLSYKELANTIEIFMQKTENFTQGDYNLNEPKNLANFILFINIISKHNTK